MPYRLVECGFDKAVGLGREAGIRSEDGQAFVVVVGDIDVLECRDTSLRG